MTAKAEIEVRLENFVKSKTAEEIYLDISRPRTVTIRHKAYGGSIALAIFWVNVLQSPNNYPVQQYPYRTLYDKNSHYKVVLRVDDVTITVNMVNGTLMIQGDFVLDWFLTRFSQVMTAFESEPRDPQPVSDGYIKHQLNWEMLKMKDREILEKELVKQKEKEENSLSIADKLIKGNTAPTKDGEEKGDNSEKVDDVEILTEHIELLNLDQWSGEILETQLSRLSTPTIKDGPSYIYKLWKSLLNTWLANADNRVYIATPFLDTDRLADVCQFVLDHRLTSNVDAFYVRIPCDHLKDISDVKKSAQERFDTKEQVIIEYRLYNRIVYPQSRFHCKFIACVDALGQASVLVTSANFHADNFKHSNLETVVYLKMSESQFVSRFLKPMNASVVLQPS